jgi:hypothetical protein
MGRKGEERKENVFWPYGLTPRVGKVPVASCPADHATGHAAEIAAAGSDVSRLLTELARSQRPNWRESGRLKRLCVGI